jgi:hypothetical protein
MSVSKACKVGRTLKDHTLIRIQLKTLLAVWSANRSFLLVQTALPEYHQKQTVTAA